MRRTLTVSMAAGLVLALLALAPAVHAQGGCSDATLTGNYGFIDSGFDARNKTGNEVPASAVGVLGFDGAGNASISYTVAINGTLTSNVTGSGTYTLGSDCTGSLSFTTGGAAGVSFNIVTVNGGTEVLGIFTVTGATQTLDAKKQW